MNGVEILNHTNIYQTKMCWWVMWVFIGIGFLIGLSFAIYNWIKQGFDGWGILCIVLVTIFCGYLGLLITMLTEHNTDTVDYIKYEVTISEDVKLSDFLSKYKIIDQ